MTTYMSKETLLNSLNTIIGLLSCINDNLCEINERDQKSYLQTQINDNGASYRKYKLLQLEKSFYECQGDD